MKYPLQVDGGRIIDADDREICTTETSDFATHQIDHEHARDLVRAANAYPRLVEALKPLSLAYKAYSESVILFPDDCKIGRGGLTVGDYRRARELLQELEDQK